MAYKLRQPALRYSRLLPKITKLGTLLQGRCACIAPTHLLSPHSSNRPYVFPGEFQCKFHNEKCLTKLSIVPKLATKPGHQWYWHYTSTSFALMLVVRGRNSKTDSMHLHRRKGKQKQRLKHRLLRKRAAEPTQWSLLAQRS